MSIVSFVNPDSNTNIVTFKDKDKKLWFKAKDVAIALGYTNPREAIIYHVRDKHKAKYEEIQGSSNSLPPCKGYNLQPHTYWSLVCIS